MPASSGPRPAPSEEYSSTVGLPGTTSTTTNDSGVLGMIATSTTVGHS